MVEVRLPFPPQTYENNQCLQAKRVWEDWMLYNTGGLFVKPALLLGMP